MGVPQPVHMPPPHMLPASPYGSPYRPHPHPPIPHPHERERERDRERERTHERERSERRERDRRDDVSSYAILFNDDQ